LENGRLECLGRIDQQIKLRGHRIELNEIATVLRDHPLVQEAVVTLREESEANKYLVAYIIAPAGMSPTYQDLQVHLHRRLPDYMIPTAFVYLDALPLTPNGKINRNALPAPDPGQGHPDDEFIAPETETQEQLSEIWIELLQLPRVSIHHNFFALGGNSLLATRLMMRIRSIFLIEVPLRYLFEAQTIASLALVIERIQNELIEQLDSEELAQMLQSQE
jgi:acyl carrier protein